MYVTHNTLYKEVFTESLVRHHFSPSSIIKPKNPYLKGDFVRTHYICELETRTEWINHFTFITRTELSYNF